MDEERPVAWETQNYSRLYTTISWREEGTQYSGVEGAEFLTSPRRLMPVEMARQKCEASSPRLDGVMTRIGFLPTAC